MQGVSKLEFQFDFNVTKDGVLRYYYYYLKKAGYRKHQSTKMRIISLCAIILTSVITSLLLKFSLAETLFVTVFLILFLWIVIDSSLMFMTRIIFEIAYKKAKFNKITEKNINLKVNEKELIIHNGTDVVTPLGDWEVILKDEKYIFLQGTGNDLIILPLDKFQNEKETENFLKLFDEENLN